MYWQPGYLYAHALWLEWTVACYSVLSMTRLCTDPLKNRISFNSTIPSLRYTQNTVQPLSKPWMHIESKGLAPLTLNFGICWRSVVSFTPRPLYPTAHSTGSWVDPRASLEGSGEEKFLALVGSGNLDQTAPHHQKEEVHSAPSERHACIVFDRTRAKTSAGNRISWERI